MRLFLLESEESTLIEVKYRDGCISIKGHAGYAEPGKDIVCAGVSTLVQNLVNSIDKLTGDKVIFSVNPNIVNVKYSHLSDDSKLLVDAFFIGINMIASVYPKNVKVVDMPAQALKALKATETKNKRKFQKFGGRNR